jgi:cytochrome c nitrite reductase small subunit
MALAAILGVLFGLGAYTFHYAQGVSYLSDESETCVNCHVMREQFDSWNRSSHRAFATCNDCHTPHDFAGKWYVKGMNGLHHSWAFTTGDFPNNILIKESNSRVAQRNCVECHQAMVANIHLTRAGHELSCVSCHGNVGHLR